MLDSYLFDQSDDDFISSEVLDRFYAPVQTDALSALVGEFTQTKERIAEVHQLITTERVSGVLGYFFSGNERDKHGRSSGLRHANAFDEIFSLDGAINDLTATYWQKALDLTGLIEVMPQARRTQWHEVLNGWRDHNYKRGRNPELDMPDFDETTLRLTIESLMNRRAEFVAERVDGVFRALSRDHVTNCPEGFNRRMIIRMFNDWGSLEWGMAGYFHDLRLVVAKFMGRDEPARHTSDKILQNARAARGDWITCDGGSLRVRGYMVGTAHIEVHPDMACRLNGILAYLHPAAIPEKSRRPPKRTSGKGFKNQPLFEQPISNAALGHIASMSPYFTLEKSTSFRREYDRHEVRWSLSDCNFCGGVSKHLKAEVAKVLSALGAVITTCKKHPHLSYWQFDYDPASAVAEVVASGALPSHASHQYYPTPEPLARELLEWAQIEPTDSVLEPSAGQGGIAMLLPPSQIVCVEISRLHCEILKAKGLNAIEADFLAWKPAAQFSCVLMNPPFSCGRWQAHLAKAGEHVAPAGRLLALLPASAKGKVEGLLPGFVVEYGRPVSGAFQGTGVTVIPVKAVRRNPQ